MNSNLSTFIEFLYVVSRAQATFEGEAKKEVDEANRKLTEDLSRIDPHAFDSPDYFWPEFIAALTI